MSGVRAAEHPRATVVAVHGDADEFADTAGRADGLNLVEVEITGRSLPQEDPHLGE